MKRALVVAAAAAVVACGGSNNDLNCSMNVAVNGGAQQGVSCLAAGAALTTGSAVSITIPAPVGTLQTAQFGIVLSSPPTARTYGAADVDSSIGQVQTTAGATYVQSKAGSQGTFSVVLTSVNPVSANGQTAYFVHGTATVTLQGQGSPGTATLNATF